MVAFVTSMLVLILCCAAVWWYARRRPVDQPLTWGEAFVGSTFVFFILFWAYGVVPHQWLTWADNELNWRPDAKILGPGSTTFDAWFPFTVTKQSMRDIVATLIYVVFLGMQIAGWILWQKRGQTKEKAPEISAYGRPLVRPAEEG